MSRRFFIGTLKLDDEISGGFSEAVRTLDDTTWGHLKDAAKAVVDTDATRNEIHFTCASDDWVLYLTITRQPDGTARVEFWEPGG